MIHTDSLSVRNEGIPIVVNGLLLSSAAFNGLSSSAQKEVLASIGLGNGDAGRADGLLIENAATPISEENGGPVELTVAMVRKLTANLSEKTLNALRIMARSDGPQFRMEEVIAGTAGATTYMDMRGVWAALTRRTRRIMDDRDVDLIWWVTEAVDKQNSTSVEYVGTISLLTYQSLRSYFKL